MTLDATHDPELKSWVESANAPGCDFPIQNLPFGIFKRKGARESPRGGVAIGDQILDLAALAIKTGPTLNGIAALGRTSWKRLRGQLSRGLSTKRPRCNVIAETFRMRNRSATSVVQSPQLSGSR